MLDLDLLVPRDQLGDANAVLASIGFAPTPEADVISAAGSTSSCRCIAIPLSLARSACLPSSFTTTSSSAVRGSDSRSTCGDARALPATTCSQRPRTCSCMSAFTSRATALAVTTTVTTRAEPLHRSPTSRGSSGTRRSTGSCWSPMLAVRPRRARVPRAVRRAGTRRERRRSRARRPATDGFDRELGRRLVALRVLRGGDHAPRAELALVRRAKPRSPERLEHGRGGNPISGTGISAAGARQRAARWLGTAPPTRIRSRPETQRPDPRSRSAHDPNRPVSLLALQLRRQDGVLAQEANGQTVLPVLTMAATTPSMTSARSSGNSVTEHAPLGGLERL